MRGHALTQVAWGEVAGLLATEAFPEEGAGIRCIVRSWGLLYHRMQCPHPDQPAGLKSTQLPLAERKDSRICFQTFLTALGDGPGVPSWASPLNEARYVLHFLNFLATPHGMWDLSSLTADQPCTPCIGRAEPLDLQGHPDLGDAMHRLPGPWAPGGDGPREAPADGKRYVHFAGPLPTQSQKPAQSSGSCPEAAPSTGFSASGLPWPPCPQAPQPGALAGGCPHSVLTPWWHLQKRPLAETLLKLPKLQVPRIFCQDPWMTTLWGVFSLPPRTNHPLRQQLTLELELMTFSSWGLGLCPDFSTWSGPPSSEKNSFQGDSRRCSSTDIMCPSVVNMYLVPDLCTGFSSSKS